jgi:hypothetical protein
VERRLLGNHPLYQFLDPIKHWLICDPGRHETVMLDLLVDLDALLTHISYPVFGRRQISGRLVQLNDLELFWRP